MAKYFTKALRCPDGSRKYIRGKTREELERKVRQAQADLGMGVNINDNTTVVEFAQMWVDTYKRPKIRPQSVDAILLTMNLHILPIIGAMKVRDVRPADCARVMMEARGKAKNTQKVIRTRMKERAFHLCGRKRHNRKKSGNLQRCRWRAPGAGT